MADVRTVEVPAPDGTMPVYEARPDGAPRGAVVVIQEVFGVNHHIQDVTRRFAAEGYLAVAPHLFHRTGSPELGYDDFSLAMPHLSALHDDAVVADIDATLGHVAGEGVDAAHTGLVGFCFGGRVSFLVATARRLGAAVGFYGGGIVTSRFPQFPSLLDRAPELQTPWLGLFGDRDRSIPVDDVEQLRAALGATEFPAEVVRYAGAGHGFHCDARPDHFDAAAAGDAWQRTLDWLDRHLR